MNLLTMLKESKSFQDKNLQDQQIFARLADTFESDPDYLFLDPIELTNTTNLGNKQMWFQFLNLEPVKNYIKSEMSYKAQVAQRRAFQALANSAEQGNVQAAKEINELSGIMSASDNNRVVVLMRVNRPEIKKTKKEEKQDEINQTN
jgi:hypothetical protein